MEELWERLPMADIKSGSGWPAAAAAGAAGSANNENCGAGLGTMDDVVEFHLYLPGAEPPSLDDLVSHAAMFLHYLGPLLDGRVWQSDPFSLQLWRGGPTPAPSAAAAAAVGRSPASNASGGIKNTEHEPWIGFEPVDGERLPPHLFGTLHFADNIDDEWLIVHLLLKLTERFPGVAASVSDADGQFLLIEAADYIPRKMTPDNAFNRVFLYGGALHFVPLTHRNPPAPSSGAGNGKGKGNAAGGADEAVATITVANALAAVRGDAVSTRAKGKVQEVMVERTQAYAAFFAGTAHGNAAAEEAAAGGGGGLECGQGSQSHAATVCVPKLIAGMLVEQPQLIAWAVTAFYDRDREDMKVCARMATFKPTRQFDAGGGGGGSSSSSGGGGGDGDSGSSGVADCSLLDPVFFRATFTRCLFAQLSQGKGQFSPPRCFPPPPPPSAPEYQAVTLGNKLTCAFEMLLGRCQKCASVAGQQQQQGRGEGEGEDEKKKKMEEEEDYPGAPAAAPMDVGLDVAAVLSSSATVAQYIQGVAAAGAGEEGMDLQQGSTVLESVMNAALFQQQGQQQQAGSAVHGAASVHGGVCIPMCPSLDIRPPQSLAAAHRERLGKIHAFVGRWLSAAPGASSAASLALLQHEDGKLGKGVYCGVRMEDVARQSAQSAAAATAATTTAVSAASSTNQANDDDAGWMDMTEAKIEELLKARGSAGASGGGAASGQQQAQTETERAEAAAVEEALPMLDNMVDKMKGFVSGTGAGPEGVDPLGAGGGGGGGGGRSKNEKKKKMKKKKKTAQGVTDGGDEVDMDPSKFLKTMRDALGLDSSHGAAAAAGEEDGLFRKGARWSVAGGGGGDDSGSSSDSEGGSSGSDNDEDGGDDFDDLFGASGSNDGASAMSDEMKELQQYFAQMDSELKGTKVADSFEMVPETEDPASGVAPEKSGGQVGGGGGDSDDDGSEEEEEDGQDGKRQQQQSMTVDVDKNLVQNLLMSFSEQHGLAGPTSNLLGSLAVDLPHLAAAASQNPTDADDILDELD